MASQMLLTAESVVADWTKVGHHCLDRGQRILNDSNQDYRLVIAVLRVLP
jgi:hypothetical protein